MTDAGIPKAAAGSEITAQSELYPSTTEPCATPQLPLAQPDPDLYTDDDSNKKAAVAFLEDELRKLGIAEI